MLKKSAIVVATVATGLLVSSPVAFAQDAAPTVSNTCSFSQSAGTISQTVVGGSGLVLGGAAIGGITPTTIQTQAGNCTSVNLSDLIDVNSNNTTVNRTRTVIQNSFNRFRFRN